MTGRRFALYFSWSRWRENAAPLGMLDNRYPTLFEFRRAIWPHYEWANDAEKYAQDVSGFLDHVVLFDFKRFTQVIETLTGESVKLLQREHDEARRFVLEDGLLKEINTLIVVSLDHLRTDQAASEEEAGAVERFLSREGNCLVICPHHDVGTAGATEQRLVEFAHHGDRLVPSQQRIGGFAKSLLEKIGLPIQNQFGLSPAPDPADPKSPARLELYQDYDRAGILAGVTTFNLHPHLPHLHVPEELAREVVVLAKQQLNWHSDPAIGPHPFVAAGNRMFNALLWAPPKAKRAGSVYVCDATLWSAAFGGVGSLELFWRNFALMPR